METTNDIITDMERFADRRWMREESGAIREFAARLRNAVKWERDAILADAAELGRGRVEFMYAASKPVGNATEMREALLEIRNTIKEWYSDDYIPHGAFSVLWDLCSDALSAPARNCDTMPYDVAVDYWNNHAVLYHGDATWQIDGGRFHNFAEWLLAPAAERKGEGDVQMY